MFPELFDIPLIDKPIRSYGFMIVVGFLLASWLASRECRRRGLPDSIYDIGVVMLLSGLFGGRLFYYLEFYDEQFAGKGILEFFKIWEGGLVFYGGGIGGALGAFLFILWKRLPVLDMGDVIAPFIPVAMGFGRLGCFLNGCCWGGVCSVDFPLGARYPRPELEAGGGEAAATQLPGALDQHIREGLVPPHAEHSLPTYPTQLYETGMDFLIAGLLFWYLRGPSPRGGGTPLLFVLYAISRFHLEFLRADNDVFLRVFGFGMTISQCVSVVLFVLFLPLFITTWLRQEIRVPDRGFPLSPPAS